MDIENRIWYGFSAILIFIAASCNYSAEVGDRNYISDFEPLNEDGEINAVVEIPAGTVEKWEVDKLSGDIKWEIEWENENGQPRVVKYLGYPGNYGMIPRTLLSLESGGDGDPLDVIVLGPPVKRGDVVKCKLIGVLEMLDDGQTDDKLIAVHPNSAFYEVNNINELEEQFGGVTDILKLWFANYKGKERVEIKGFGDRQKAHEILESAMEEYEQYEY
jgi:inorganic pyrophosphatase